MQPEPTGHKKEPEATGPVVEKNACLHVYTGTILASAIKIN